MRTFKINSQQLSDMQYGIINYSHCAVLKHVKNSYNYEEGSVIPILKMRKLRH